MPKFTEIVDSKSNNVNSKDSIYKNCGVVGSDEARGSDFPSEAELRASQQRGGEGNGTASGNYNDQEKVFNQNYSSAPGDAPEDDSTPSSGCSPLAWMP